MITEEDMEVFGYYDMVDNYNKPTKSVQEMVTEYNNTAGNKKDPLLYSKLVGEEHLEFCNAQEGNYEAEQCGEFTGDQVDYAAELKELADKVYVEYGYAWVKGWDLDEAVRRVHKNNMERMYQDDGTIKRREDGKILKNPNTPKVNLEDLV